MPALPSRSHRQLRARSLCGTSLTSNKSITMDTGQSWADFSPGQCLFIYFYALAGVFFYQGTSRVRTRHAAPQPPPTPRRLPGAGANSSASPALPWFRSCFDDCAAARARLPGAAGSADSAPAPGTPEVAAASLCALLRGTFGRCRVHEQGIQLALLVPPALPLPFQPRARIGQIFQQYERC